MILKLNILNLVKQLLDMDDLHDKISCLIDSLVKEHIDSICMKDSLELCLYQFVEHIVS